MDISIQLTFARSCEETYEHFVFARFSRDARSGDLSNTAYPLECERKDRVSAAVSSRMRSEMQRCVLIF